MVEKVRRRNVWRRVAPRELLFGPILRIEAGSFFPLGFGGQPLPYPLCVSRSFKITDMRDRLVGLFLGSMQAMKIADHPLTVPQLPVKRRPPLLPIHGLPAFAQPPTIIVVTAVVHEFEKLAVADRSAVNRE